MGALLPYVAVNHAGQAHNLPLRHSEFLYVQTSLAHEMGEGTRVRAVFPAPIGGREVKGTGSFLSISGVNSISTQKKPPVFTGGFSKLSHWPS